MSTLPCSWTRIINRQCIIYITHPKLSTQCPAWILTFVTILTTDITHDIHPSHCQNLPGTLEPPTRMLSSENWKSYAQSVPDLPGTHLCMGYRETQLVVAGWIKLARKCLLLPWSTQIPMVYWMTTNSARTMLVGNTNNPMPTMVLLGATSNSSRISHTASLIKWRESTKMCILSWPSKTAKTLKWLNDHSKCWSGRVWGRLRLQVSW
jgi:hypothetical protein